MPTIKSLILVSGLLVIGFPVISAAQLVPYDDFNGTRINPEKWHGVEGSGGQFSGPNTEIGRRIMANALELHLTSYGGTSSDSGTAAAGNNRLRVNNPGSVTALQADVAVMESQRQDCPANGTPTRTRTMLNGAFFNDGGSTGPDDRTGDVVARIDKQGDRAGQIIAAVILRCNDPECDTTTTLNFHIFATKWTLGTTDTLKLEWDEFNDRFRAVVNPGSAKQETADLPYSVSDTNPPAFAFKELRIQNQVANCTADRMRSSIKARFNNVMTNP